MWLWLYFLLKKAIIQFRNASDHKNAISMLLRVAKMNETRGNAFHAGKSLDSASAACRDIGEFISKKSKFDYFT